MAKNEDKKQDEQASGSGGDSAAKTPEPKPAAPTVQPDSSKAAAQEAPPASAPPEFRTLHDELDRHARAAAKALDHEAHALLNEVLVAVGALKRKAAAAREKLSGEAAQLIEALHRFL